MLSMVEQSRLMVSKAIGAERKSLLGQFFTPAATARFMAGLFNRTSDRLCRLLDAGAGIGSLSAAFLERWMSGDFDFSRIELDAFEIDDSLHRHLDRTLAAYGGSLKVKIHIRPHDFVQTAVDALRGSLFEKSLPAYTHAILNPPYKKIRSNSSHRAALRQVDIETVNLYSAFVALALALLGNGGQLVAILPRSFCNGPYYRPFREFILKRAAIHHMHLFGSRSKAFKDDDVLQENIIVLLEKGGHQGHVKITTSTDDGFSDMQTNQHPFDRIVFPDDPELFIRVPTSAGRDVIELPGSIQFSLDQIGIKVSTGPVVDFRLKEYLRDMPEANTVPLLYPGHFSGRNIEWPKPGLKKPNAILQNAVTEKWLYPNGFYCVVRRFSSKEEKRRIVACVVRPDSFRNSTLLGLENHLNVFHEGKKGLPEKIAYGLATYLNSTAVDDTFRGFSGHTQVNATDLRLIKYPSRETLSAMGRWALRCIEPTQAIIDEKMESLRA